METSKIWSISYRGHLAHAYPDPRGSARCRKNLPARTWLPDFQPSFKSAEDAAELFQLCPRCVAKLEES